MQFPRSRAISTAGFLGAISLAAVCLALSSFRAHAQSPSVLYTWAGTGNVQQWFKNFGANTVTLDNTVAGELHVTETGAAGSPVAITDDFNRVRETPSGPSGGLDLTGLDYLEFDIGHNGAGNISVQFFVQATPSSSFVALGPDVAATPGVNTYQVPLSGLTAAQLVYIRTLGFNARDHAALGNVVWTLREVRAGGTPLTTRDLVTHDTGTAESGLQGALVSFDGASVLGNTGQNQTGLSQNPAGSGSLQWTDVGGGAGGAISWGNGTALNGNTFNNRTTDLSNYGSMIVRISAREVTPGLGGTINVQSFFQVNNFGSFLTAGTLSLPIDGQFHDLTYSLAGLANMNVVDQTGINLGSHTANLIINVDLVRFISLDPPVLNCPSNVVAECTGGLTPVSFVATASDASGSVPVTCTPPSGSGFRLGTTNVTCTASNAAGVRSCSFTVTVRDTTPPTLDAAVTVPVQSNHVCNSAVTIQSPTSAGVMVQYIASAFDACGIASFNCVPNSGSTFPVGTNTVTCRAVDGSGNSNVCSFKIIILAANQCPTASVNVSPTLAAGCVALSNVVIAANNLDACVVLDGTASSDPDGDPLSYSWTVDGQFTTILDSSQEPGGGGTGSGIGTVALAGNSLAINLSFSGLSANATATHIHGPAPLGINAAVLYPLNSIATLGGTAGTINGTVTLVDGTGGFTLAQQLQQLRAGLWYVNIHTTAHPGGEIRGQLEGAAQGAQTTNCLPIGTHEVCLAVSDAQCSDTSCVTVEVISPCEAVGTLIAAIESSSLPRNRQRPLIASLKAACASFDDGRFVPGINQLQAFQNKVRAQVAPVDDGLATRLIKCAQDIVDALSRP